MLFRLLMKVNTHRRRYLHPIELSFTGLASIIAPVIVNAHPCVPRSHGVLMCLPMHLLTKLCVCVCVCVCVFVCVVTQVDDVDLAMHLDSALGGRACWLRLPILAVLGASKLDGAA